MLDEGLVSYPGYSRHFPFGMSILVKFCAGLLFLSISAVGAVLGSVYDWRRRRAIANLRRRANSVIFPTTRHRARLHRLGGGHRP